ncbi:MAG: ribosome biogenesis GTP-binding protein YihA/YsxC [Gammaproteobacteria bacterium]
MHRNPSSPPPEHAYFRRARFLLSVDRQRDLPRDEGREIAFVGRSNVGKSSVINALCDQQGLARTSRTPGRTQQFVLFDVGEDRRLMDLPGFGYALVDKATRAHWRTTMPRYLETRAALAGLVLIADARHPLKQDELDLVSWTLAARVPLVVLLNKADKLGRQATLAAMRAAAREVAARGGDPDAVRAFSATARTGVPELRALLHAWFTAETERD